MEIANFTIKEFFGFLFIAVFYIWISHHIFFGFGIFRDQFFVSNRRRRR